MTVYSVLADAIRLRIDNDPDLTLPVYDNPLDAVQVPCVMVLAGDITPASFAGHWMHELRVNCLALRADTEGGIELADRLAMIVSEAAATLTSAAFLGASRPQTFTISGVDYLGRECAVTITQRCQ